MRSRFLSPGTAAVLAVGERCFRSRLSPVRFRQGRSEGDLRVRACLHCWDVFQLWASTTTVRVKHRKAARRRAQSIIT